MKTDRVGSHFPAVPSITWLGTPERCPLRIVDDISANRGRDRARFGRLESNLSPGHSQRIAESPTTGHAADASLNRGETRNRISDGLVGLFKEYYGRGPDQARAYYVDDVVVVVLRGGFTRVEQTLLEGGHRNVVIDQRMMFQEVMGDRFKALVHEVTGREVLGFVSGNQPDPEMTCEVFVLAPQSSGPDGSAS